MQPIGDSAAIPPATGRGNPYIGLLPYATMIVSAASFLAATESARPALAGAGRAARALLRTLGRGQKFADQRPSAPRVCAAKRSPSWARRGSAGSSAEPLCDAIANVYLFNLLRDLDQGVTNFRRWRRSGCPVSWPPNPPTPTAPTAS